MAGATHLSFTDVPFYAPAHRFGRAGLAQARTAAIVNRYVLTFFERYVAGRASPLLEPGAPVDAGVTLERRNARTPFPRTAAS